MLPLDWLTAMLPGTDMHLFFYSRFDRGPYRAAFHLVLLVGLIAMAVTLAVVNNPERHDGHKGVDNNDDLPSSPPSTAQLVETIPVSDFNLTLSPGAVNTHEALVGLQSELKSASATARS